MKKILICFLIFICGIIFVFNIIDKLDFKNEVKNYLYAFYDISEEVQIKIVQPTIKDRLLYLLPKDANSGLLYVAEVLYEDRTFKVIKNKGSYTSSDSYWYDTYNEKKDTDEEREIINDILSKYSDNSFAECIDNGISTGIINYNFFLKMTNKDNMEEIIDNLEKMLDKKEKPYTFTLYLVKDDYLVNNARKNAKRYLDGLAQKYREEEFDNFDALTNDDLEIIYRGYRNYNGEIEWTKILIVE